MTFPKVILILLQKSVKSLQLVLNEFFIKLNDKIDTATSSAFTQARSKLSHEAFIELNQKAIVNTFYEDEKYNTYYGFRLVGIDGSKIVLPNKPCIKKYFGTYKVANQKEKFSSEYPVAVASVLYDLLNNIVLDSKLEHSRSYEVDLAIEHLKYCKINDLLIFDRGYPSYRFLATLYQKGYQYVGRVSRQSFKESQEMFTGNMDSKIVILKPNSTIRKEIKEAGLPLEIHVRFVRVILENGEVEVLVTSLLDEDKYPSKMFKELYHQRWGVETFYGIIKGRLNVENFTGKSVEAVKQDFYATIFISGLESLLSEEAQETIDKKNTENKYPQNVNKAVSFNAIKNHVVPLFYGDEAPEIILAKLTKLFMQNPNCVRANRQAPRKKSSVRASLNYQKRIRKMCF